MQKCLFPVFLALAVANPVPAKAEPLARVHTSYYYIDGLSATVLAAQMDQLGPEGPDGKRHPAKTKWDVQWKFNREQQGVICSVKEVMVAVGIAQMLPKWRGDARGPAPLRTRWKQFGDALRQYENGRRERGLKAANEVEAALRATRPAGNCEDMEIAANAAAQQIMEKHRKLDEERERRTDFGRTEGATLL